MKRKVFIACLLSCLVAACLVLCACSVVKQDNGDVVVTIHADQTQEMAQQAAANAQYFADMAHQAAEHVYAQVQTHVVEDGQGAPFESNTIVVSFDGDGVSLREFVESIGGTWVSDNLMFNDGVESHEAVLNFDSAQTREALQALVDKLAEVPGVIGSHLNYVAETEGYSAYSKGTDWSISACGFDDVWQAVDATDKVVVGVVDGFMWANHPDLKDNVWMGWNAVTSEVLSDDYLSGASYTHGTSVAGIISAVNGNAHGVDGLSNNATMILMECGMANGGLSTTACHNSIRLLAGMPYPVDVINMSWGVNGLDPEKSESDAAFIRDEQEVIEYAHSRGVVLVGAAGNSGPLESACYPARFDEVIGVAALENEDELLCVSQTGEGVDIAAPGWNVMSTSFVTRNAKKAEYYATFGYTSCAAPHVSAAAALLRTAHPNMAPDEVKRILCEHAVGDTVRSGVNLGTSATGHIGAGMLHLDIDMFVQPPDKGRYVKPAALLSKYDHEFDGVQGNASFAGARYQVTCDSATAVFETDSEGNLSFAQAEPVEGVWLCREGGENCLPEGRFSIKELSSSNGYIKHENPVIEGYVVCSGSDAHLVWIGRS